MSKKTSPLAASCPEENRAVSAAVPPRRGRRPAGLMPGREALIRAASVCFQRQGYAVSLRTIAREAGVDMALVGRLFGSKARLWETVVAWHEGLLARHLGKVEALARLDIPLRDKMRRFFALHAALCLEDPGMITLLLHEAINDGPRQDHIMHRLVMPLHGGYASFLRQATETGRFCVKDAELALFMVQMGISIALAVPGLTGSLGGQEGQEASASSQQRPRLASRLVDEAVCLLLGPSDSRCSSGPEGAR